MSEIKFKKYSVLHTAFFAVLLILFSTVSVTAELLQEQLPDGFKLSKPVEFYDSGNLFELINGQAVFYLSYGFLKLDHGFYEKEGVSYKVDVYEVRDVLSALGCYREQKDDDAADMNVGTEGYVLDYLASFYKNRYYVEIVPVSEGVVKDMTLLAGHVAKNIPGNIEIPKELSLFPSDGLIPESESYIGENLLSYTFLGHGLVAKYQTKVESKTITAFISLAGNEENARKICDDFRGKLQNPSEITLTGNVKGVSGIMPYRGKALVFPYKGYAFGFLGVEDNTQALEILKKIHDKL